MVIVFAFHIVVVLVAPTAVTELLILWVVACASALMAGNHSFSGESVNPIALPFSVTM